MAQIAIPIALLGGLYILANNDEDKSENFENQNRDLENKHYDMVKNEIDRFDPNIKNNNEVEQVNDSDVLNNSKPYLNPNTHTDKYFFQNASNVVMQKDNKTENNNNFELLNGNTININDFKHNNAVPNFGSKVKGASVDNSNFDNMLDTMQGAGSQFIEKKELGNFFNPEDNVQWSNGMPNMSEFYMSRVNPSNRACKY